MNWWLLPATVGLSWLLTGLLRRYALSRRLLDIPNARSSHTTPTPRGGGAAIVLAFMAALPVLRLGGGVTTSALVGLAGAGALVALIGFWDDHDHLSAGRRLAAHFLAAGWVLYWLGGLPPLPLFGFMVDFGWLGHLLAAVYLVWLLNLYNFMDGIDGIAGIEAITVAIGGGLLGWWLIPAADGWLLPVVLAAAVAGFLGWNFPVAKIFMGDAGSGFVGLLLGIFSIQAAWLFPALFWSWVILLGVFVVDATLTLLRRILRGKKFYEAHRSHAYQHAARVGGSHPKVSLATGAINIFWLLPVAALVAQGLLPGVVGVAIAYPPLVWLAMRFKAGEMD